MSQSSSCTTAPLIKSSPGSQEEVHPSGSSCSSGAPYLSIPHHHQHHHHQHATANSCSSEASYATHAVGRDTEATDGGRYAPSGSHSHVDFKSYVSRIVWEADNDCEALPPDSYHVWCVEGSGSSAGSLSSLGSAAPHRNISPEEEEDDDDEGGFAHDRLSQWGPKFQALSEMYDRPQLVLTYRDAVAYMQRSHDLLPHHH